MPSHPRDFLNEDDISKIAEINRHIDLDKNNCHDRVTAGMYLTAYHYSIDEVEEWVGKRNRVCECEHDLFPYDQCRTGFLNIVLKIKENYRQFGKQSIPRGDGRGQGQGDLLEQLTEDFFSESGYETERRCDIFGEQSDVFGYRYDRSPTRILAECKDYDHDYVRGEDVYRLVRHALAAHARPFLVHNYKLTTEAENICNRLNVIVLGTDELESQLDPYHLCENTPREDTGRTSDIVNNRHPIFPSHVPVYNPFDLLYDLDFDYKNIN